MRFPLPRLYNFAELVLRIFLTCYFDIVQVTVVMAQGTTATTVGVMVNTETIIRHMAAMMGTVMTVTMAELEVPVVVSEVVAPEEPEVRLHTFLEIASSRCF